MYLSRVSTKYLLRSSYFRNIIQTNSHFYICFFQSKTQSLSCVINALIMTKRARNSCTISQKLIYEIKPKFCTFDFCFLDKILSVNLRSIYDQLQSYFPVTFP